MANGSVTLTSIKEEPHECSCGCAPCAEESCDLICPTRPSFFCGQLLTDQDLTALVTWTQDRLRLQRYRTGWGVVCGLAVRRRKEESAHLVVSPGYAVSCCGDDLVLCHEVPVDLTRTCLPEQQPCSEQGDETAPYVFVDLVLQASDEPTAFQTSLGCSGHKGEADCEPSRIVESAQIIAVPVDMDKLERDPWQDRLDEYRAWWRDWWEQHPPQEHGKAPLTYELPERGYLWWYELLEAFWHAANRDGCHVCAKDKGVPLARILVRRFYDDDRQREKCVVVIIDAHPPARRLLGREQSVWDGADLALFLGRDWRGSAPEIKRYLHQHGIVLSPAESTDDPHVVKELLLQDPRAAFGSRITPVLAEVGRLGQRIVGFKATGHAGLAAAHAVSAVEEEPQDLTKLYGIGGKTAEDLYRAGIVTYEQVSKLSLDDMNRIVRQPLSRERYEHCMADARRLMSGGS